MIPAPTLVVDYSSSSLHEQQFLQHRLPTSFQQWNGSDGNPSALFYRLADDYLIRFPEIADFRVSARGEDIACLPSTGSGERWQAVYQQQVLPLLPSLTGDPVYHGAAIAFKDVAIAFLGPSGFGKSTLAAAFAARGYPFLGDDCLQLSEAADGEVHVQPHADHIRLWQDSIDALAPSQAITAHARGSTKPHLAASAALPHCNRALPLRRVYVLGDGLVDTATVTPLSAASTIMGWTRNAFVLDIKSPTVLQRSFSAATRLAQHVPGRHLDYPRSYDALDDVLACVLADVATPA